MNFLRRSVTTKLTAGVAVVVLAVVTFLVLFFSSGQQKLLLASLDKKGESLARLAAHDAAPALEFDDRDAQKDVLGGIQLDSDVMYAGLYGADGQKHVSELGQLEGGLPVPAWEALPSDGSPQRASGNGFTQLAARVTSRTGTKGVLVLRLTTAHVTAEAAQARRLALLVGLFAVLAGVALAALLGRSIGARIRRVSEVAIRVGRGQLSQMTIGDAGGDEIGAVAQAFDTMIVTLRALEQHVQRVAAGDLSTSTALEGDLAQAFNRMIESQRQLVAQIRDTALQVNTGAAEFLASSRQQQQGATEQSSAVEETRRTMENLLGASREIAGRAQVVLQNAERTQENSNIVASRIAALSKHAQRIQEILEIIKDIANKSDLLALNAALEGTKAGEVGRGFSLVATQMQRLAENVMGSVSDIKELTATISEATQSSVLATEESTKLAADTTRSAQQITTIIQQQQSGTEQVSRAMDDVSLIASQTVTGAKQVVRSTEELMRLSTELQQLVSRFQLDTATARPATASEAPAVRKSA